MERTQSVVLTIALIVLVVAISWAVFQYIRFYRSEHLVCPKCGHQWKPPVVKMIFAVNAVDGKVIRCPKCGSKEYMKAEKDQKNEKDGKDGWY